MIKGKNAVPAAWTNFTSSTHYDIIRVFIWYFQYFYYHFDLMYEWRLGHEFCGQTWNFVSAPLIVQNVSVLLQAQDFDPDKTFRWIKYNTFTPN